MKENAARLSAVKPWETLHYDRKTTLVEQFAKRGAKQGAYHEQILMSVLKLVELVPISDPKNSVPQWEIEPWSLAFWVSTILKDDQDPGPSSQLYYHSGNFK